MSSNELKQTQYPLSLQVSMHFSLPKTLSEFSLAPPSPSPENASMRKENASMRKGDEKKSKKRARTDSSLPPDSTQRYGEAVRPSIGTGNEHFGWMDPTKP